MLNPVIGLDFSSWKIQRLVGLGMVVLFRPKAEVRVFILSVGLKFKSAIQIIKVVGWISEAPSTIGTQIGGWRFAYPPYGPAINARVVLNN
ncbi:hypothetical protein RPD76_04420 [Methylomonas sp. MV1]|uniref:hypothetical protein n=1 Tax=Methylomonas sp. MV1 TaxID=3073620 RepID=UPI0028A3714F|nr:hypothetical protein [Methylomonas sp. MV1]MDT4329138.1 hypothetical protein [Methylomonas sp. MV1]